MNLFIKSNETCTDFIINDNYDGTSNNNNQLKNIFLTGLGDGQSKFKVPT